ncbi:MAG: TVP38/TMEM64 family protein [Candidatus Poribacteria bacterium]|nr:TVP38/TMEM64 family protein [Candidatus Poribacteria bacterium]
MSKIISSLRSVFVHKKPRIVLLLVVLIGFVLGGIYHRRIWEYCLELTAAFQSIETARAYIASYGALAPIVSAILMVFQSVIAPLPAFLITFANGTLFGFWWGSLLSWSSSMVGAAFCFYIARYLGIQRITRLISQPAVEKANDFVEKYGTYAILIARLMPFISFDVISYFAGATRMRFLGFWIATGIGQMPATLVYSYLGESASPHIKWILFAFGIVIAISIVKWLLKTRT